MLTATWAQDDAVKYGIQVGEMQVTSANATAIYNLQGQRVERPTKGIYIPGRRKVAV